MKVYIGPYRNWIGPYQVCDLLKYIGIKKETRDKIAEKIPSEPFQWFHNLFPRKIKIKIHDYDYWNADTTLAYVIAPVLKKLRANLHGNPSSLCVDGVDHDVTMKQWEDIVDKMIWSMEQINIDWEEQFYTWEKIHELEVKDEKVNYLGIVDGKKLKIDFDGLNAHRDKMQEGFELFGKYFTALWD